MAFLKYGAQGKNKKSNPIVKEADTTFLSTEVTVKEHINTQIVAYRILILRHFKKIDSLITDSNVDL